MMDFADVVLGQRLVPATFHARPDRPLVFRQWLGTQDASCLPAASAAGVNGVAH
jgi:hypothetical protein